MSKFIKGLVCCALITLAGCKDEPSPEPLQRSHALSGEQLYLNCRACHGPQGEGIKGMAPALASSNYLSDDAHLIAIIRDGYRSERGYAAAMQGFESKFSDSEIATLVNWMRQRWSPASSDLSTEAVTQERRSKAPLGRPLRTEDFK